MTAVRHSDCAHWESPAEAMAHCTTTISGPSPWDTPDPVPQDQYLGLDLGLWNLLPEHTLTNSSRLVDWPMMDSRGLFVSPPETPEAMRNYIMAQSNYAHERAMITADQGYALAQQMDKQIIAVAKARESAVSFVMDSVTGPRPGSLVRVNDIKAAMPVTTEDHQTAEVLKDRIIQILGNTTHTKVFTTIHKGTTVLLFVRAGRAHSPKLYVSPKSTDEQIKALIELVTTLPLEL